MIRGQKRVEKNSNTSTLHAKNLNFNSETLTRIIESQHVRQLPSNRIYAQQLLDHMAEQFIPAPTNKEESRSQMQSETESEISISSSKKDKTASFEKPSSTRMCLFQLTESNELARVSAVLEELSTKPKETIRHLSKKYKLHTTVSQNVLKKYCNGDYGFDKVIAREGQF